jgi:hypothetical protein
MTDGLHRDREAAQDDGEATENRGNTSAMQGLSGMQKDAKSALSRLFSSVGSLFTSNLERVLTLSKPPLPKAAKTESHDIHEASITPPIRHCRLGIEHRIEPRLFV